MRVFNKGLLSDYGDVSDAELKKIFAEQTIEDIKHHLKTNDSWESKYYIVTKSD